MTMEEIIKAAVLIYLGIEAIADYKKKTVSLYAGAAAAVSAIIYNTVFHRMSAADMALGSATGAAVLLAGLISGQRIGCGDGLILIVIGIWLGGLTSFITLAFGSSAASAILLFLIVIRKIKRGHEIGFVPFLLVGFVGVMICV